MFRSTIALCLLAIALIMSACAAPVDAPDVLVAAPEALAMGKKKFPDPMATLAGAGSNCKVNEDCMPTAKECGVAACVDGVCAVVALPKGDACQSGVGVCDGFGECGKVVGVCKAWDGPALSPCDAAIECDDGSPCTSDTCDAGWCRHDPLPDGKACGPSLSCNQGLCCVPS